MTSVFDDDSDDIEALSVIPYDTHRDVVLRHADSVVEFDPLSRQLVPRNRSHDIEPHSPTQDTCPTCGRSWHDDPVAPPVSAPGQDAEPNFINHDYFRMLARSLPGSTDSSTPPSPRRRTIQPARSRLATSPTLPPAVSPSDAEFAGSAPAPFGARQGISETAFTPQYFEKFFVIEKELGRGGRGVVLLVKHMLDGVFLGQFACKRVPIGDDHTWLEKVLVEVQALQSLSHQNLVSYRHVWLEDYQLNTFGPSVPCAFILQQYCNGGDLHNYVCSSAQVKTTTQDLKDRIRRRSRGETELPRKANEPKKLPFEEIYAFFRDITAGLVFLHLHGFIHRDLKPSNCLLHTVGEEMRVLVSDFGEVQYEKATRKSTGATGTISYCAPEVLYREIPDGPFGNFTPKSDIFSLGMILHFLCFANLPYLHADVLHEEREDLTKLRAEIVEWAGFDEQRRPRPDLPAKLYVFLKRLLSIDPESRPTAEEVNMGIRLGSLDQVPDTPRRHSVSPEELTPGRRIQKVDSPAPSTRRRTRRDSARGSHLRLRSGAEDESPLADMSGAASETGTEDHVLIDVRKARRASKAGALVTQPVAGLPSPNRPSPSPERKRQLLLPASPQPWWLTQLSQLRHSLRIPVSSPSIRLSVLAVKLVSAVQPCASRGFNPVSLYPLLALAMLEFISNHLPVWKFVGALLLHLAVLAYGLRTDSLCYHGRPAWGDGPKHA